MIEKQDDLCQLMSDIRRAYAFQDVEKNHNPIRKQNMNIILKLSYKIKRFNV
jgi:hypothetical protein